MNGYWNHTTTTLWRAPLLAALLVLQGIVLAAPAAEEFDPCVLIPEGEIRYATNYGCNAGGVVGNLNQSGVIGQTGSPVTAVPNGDWEFEQWNDGNTSATRSDIFVCWATDPMPTFRARFVREIRYFAETGGTLSGQTTQRLACGEWGTEVIPVANPGYFFAGWSDWMPGDARTDLPTTVPESGEVTALFLQTGTVQLVYTAGPGGRILGDANQQVLYYGTGTAVIAEPDEGYKFKEWSDGSTSPGRQDTVAGWDLAFTATFVPVFRIQYEAGEGGTISGNTDQYVELGGDGTSVMAVPDVGWQFVIWSGGTGCNTDRCEGEFDLDSPIRAETNVTRNYNPVAIFAPIFTSEELLQVYVSPPTANGKRGIVITHPNGVRVSSLTGDGTTRAFLYIPMDTNAPLPLLNRINMILRNRVQHNAPRGIKDGIFIKTKTSCCGVRGKSEDDCDKFFILDFEDWEYLVDNDRISGSFSDELVIEGPFTPEDSGTYFQLYFDEETQQWARTEVVIIEVSESPQLDLFDCNLPLPSMQSAYGAAAFQDLASVPLAPITTADMDGLLRGELNIYDYWEVALFEHVAFHGPARDLKFDAEAAFAFNLELLQYEEPAMLGLLEAAGALPFAAATLAISSEWQAAWAELGLTQNYELVQLPGGKSGNNEPLSPGGDLNNDGLTNQQAFDQVVQNGGDVLDYILLADGFGIEPEPANMPVGGAGAALLLLGLGGIAALARRRR